MGSTMTKLKKFRFLFSKNKRFRTIVITAGLIFLAVFLAVFSFIMVRVETSGKLTMAISTEPKTLDPTFCDNKDTETLLVNCFEGLMKVDEKGNAVKAAASEYTVSTDGLVYTFTIANGALWSDGTAVEASDFVYAWRRTANPYNSSSYAYMFEIIDGYDKILEDFEKEKNKETNEDGNYITVNMADLGVKAVDSRTLEVRLKEKDPSFLYKCTSVAFLPLCEDAVRPNTRIWGEDPELFVCNGAFKLSAWTSGSYLELLPNEYFREKDKVKLESVKVYFAESEEEAYEMYNSSDVFYTNMIPAEKLEKAAKKKDYVAYDELGTYFLYFNTSEAPFDDVRVRQALTLAVDREKIVNETALNRGKPAGALISDGFSSFRQGSQEYISPTNKQSNIDKARKLLEEAGYKDGKGFPKFEYVYNDNEISHETAKLLQSMWKTNLGIECSLKSVSWSKLDELRKSGNFSVAKGGIMAPYNSTYYILDSFTTENNFCNWSNKEYDSLVKQMINSQSESAYTAESILMKDFVVCPIYYYTGGYLKSKRLENFYVTNSGIAYFMYADVKVF